MKVGGDAKTQDMLGAACWADDIKRDHRETAPWHYADQHFRLDRKPEHGAFDSCIRQDLGVMARVPLASGFLTGKYKPGQAPPADSRAAASSMNYFFSDELRNDALLERVQQLGEVAKDLGITMAQLALAWVLREPNVASTIIGASRPEQVVDNAGASGIALDGATLTRIDEILGDFVAYEGPAS